MIIRYWNTNNTGKRINVRTRRIQNGLWGEIVFRWILARYDKHEIVSLEVHDESATA